MSDQKLQALAESPLLKVLQYIVTAIAMPIILWAITTVLDRLGKLEEAVQKGNTHTATTELRLQAAERSATEVSGAVRLLTESSVRHEYEIRSLKEAQQNRSR